jgi:hypothetical protein
MRRPNTKNKTCVILFHRDGSSGYVTGAALNTFPSLATASRATPFGILTVITNQFLIFGGIGITGTDEDCQIPK